MNPLIPVSLVSMIGAFQRDILHIDKKWLFASKEDLSGIRRVTPRKKYYSEVAYQKVFF
jgi:hypothetical protein